MILLPISIFATFILLFFGSSVQLKEYKPSPITLFIWLLIITYLSLIFSTPYFLFILFLSTYIVKIFIESHLWNKFMKYSLYLLFFIILFNIFLMQNGIHKILETSWLTITWESIAFAFSMALRILLIMGAFSIFNSNVNMDEIIEILDKLRFPQGTLITIALSLRFFGIIAEDASQSADVLRVRGVQLSSGKIRDRIKARYPVMLSLLNNSLERGIQIAEALETKGFPSRKRKPWRRISFPPREILLTSFLILAAFLATIFLIRGMGEELVPSHLYHYLLISILSTAIAFSRREEHD